MCLPCYIVVGVEVIVNCLLHLLCNFVQRRLLVLVLLVLSFKVVYLYTIELYVLLIGGFGCS
jgi:hypothetical protein